MARASKLTPSERMYRAVSEAEFQRDIIDAAKLNGWAHYHTHDSRRSPEGFPDLVLVKPPRIVYAELKREGGQLNPNQVRWINQLTECGQEVHIWRPSDASEVWRVLGYGENGVQSEV